MSANVFRAFLSERTVKCQYGSVVSYAVNTIQQEQFNNVYLYIYKQAAYTARWPQRHAALLDNYRLYTHIILHLLN